jgi:hypothetical protein
MRKSRPPSRPELPDGFGDVLHLQHVAHQSDLFFPHLLGDRAAQLVPRGCGRRGGPTGPRPTVLPSSDHRAPPSRRRSRRSPRPARRGAWGRPTAGACTSSPWARLANSPTGAGGPGRQRHPGKGMAAGRDDRPDPAGPTRKPSPTATAGGSPDACLRKPFAKAAMGVDHNTSDEMTYRDCCPWPSVHHRRRSVRLPVSRVLEGRLP